MTRRRFGALGLACLTAALPGPLPAQPAHVSGGDVTPDACAAFGFRSSPEREYRARPQAGGFAGGRLYAAPPPPPPAPPPVVQNAPAIPPLPVPPVERRIQEPSAPKAAQN